MNTITREGVIYTRVSSLKQVTQGSGLDSQYSACLAHATENKITILESFQDAAYSGKTTDRPGLEKLIAFLKQRKNKTYVIFDTVDRLSRDTEDYFFLKMTIRKYNGFLISLKDDLESDNPIDQLKETMVVAFADFDRKKNLERVNSRMKEKVKSGYWLHRPPVGMLLENKVLVPDNMNSRLIKKIYEDFAIGKYISFESIKFSKEARQLINLSSGSPYKLKNGFIKNMLSNKLYIGIIDSPKWGLKDIKAKHEGFINKDLFAKVQRRIKSKTRKNYSVVGIDHFPLKGDIQCGHCSNKLTGNYSTGRNKKHPYYRCNSSKEICGMRPKNIKRNIIHDDFIKLLQKVRINTEVLELADKVMEDTFNKNSNHHKGIKNHNDSKIKDLMQRKKLQIDKLLITSNKSVVKALEKEIESIDSQIKALEQYKFSSEDLVTFKLKGKALLSHPDKEWEKANSKLKKIIFNYIFEKNLKVVDGRIGTASYTLPYRLMSNNSLTKNGMVELGGIEPPTSCVPRKRSPS